MSFVYEQYCDRYAIVTPYKLITYDNDGALGISSASFETSSTEDIRYMKSCVEYIRYRLNVPSNIIFDIHYVCGDRIAKDPLYFIIEPVDSKDNNIKLPQSLGESICNILNDMHRLPKRMWLLSDPSSYKQPLGYITSLFKYMSCINISLVDILTRDEASRLREIQNNLVFYSDCSEIDFDTINIVKDGLSNMSVIISKMIRVLVKSSSCVLPDDSELISNWDMNKVSKNIDRSSVYMSSHKIDTIQLHRRGKIIRKYPVKDPLHRFAMIEYCSRDGLKCMTLANYLMVSYTDYTTYRATYKELWNIIRSEQTGYVYERALTNPKAEVNADRYVKYNSLSSINKSEITTMLAVLMSERNDREIERLDLIE
jgi:hypothetical protein